MATVAAILDSASLLVGACVRKGWKKIPGGVGSNNHTLCVKKYFKANSAF